MKDLHLTGLHKRFGNHQVLAGLELAVPAGSFTALLGPSGAGKTTLLRLLAGFETPDAGTIAIGDRVVAGDGVRVAPDKRRIGYVPQEGSLFPHLSVAANIGFGLPRARRAARVAPLLELVGLTDLGRRYPHQLSGGQQQRVALARALAIEPEVVLLDEPFAALDEHLREGLRREVKRIVAQAGATTLLVTHNQDEALSTADLVAVMHDGRIAQCGSPDELYAQPTDEQLARFVGAANLLDGMFDGDAVNTVLGRLPIQPPTRIQPGPVKVLIRPEQITLAGPTTADGSIGRVTSRSFHGHDTVLHVELTNAFAHEPLTVRTLGNPNLAEGDSCSLAASGRVIIWSDASDPIPA